MRFKSHSLRNEGDENWFLFQSGRVYLLHECHWTWNWEGRGGGGGSRRCDRIFERRRDALARAEEAEAPRNCGKLRDSRAAIGFGYYYEMAVCIMRSLSGDTFVELPSTYVRGRSVVARMHGLNCVLHWFFGHCSWETWRLVRVGVWQVAVAMAVGCASSSIRILLFILGTVPIIRQTSLILDQGFLFFSLMQFDIGKFNQFFFPFLSQERFYDFS